MAVIYGTYNQQLKSSVSLPSTTGSLFYFTLPWYPQSLIDEVRFWNTSGTACTVTSMLILNDGAHYRNSSTDNKGQIVYRDPTDKQTHASDSYYASWSMTPAVYSDNLYNRPFINVLISTIGSTTITPTIQLIGRKAVGNTYLDTDAQGLLVDRTYRVLVEKSAAGIANTVAYGIGSSYLGTVYDVTGVVTRRGGLNASQAGFASTTDFLYVGSENKVNHFEFNLSTPHSGTATTLLMQFWNGTVWTGAGVTVLDNTSSGNSDTMRQSGILEANIASLTTWTKTRLTGTGNTLILDPITGLGVSITAGQVPPVGMFYDPERYWWRFKMVGAGVSAGTPVSFASILPIAAPYS